MKSKAILNLRKDSVFNLVNGEIEWLDTEQTQPTEQEIQDEIVRLEAQDKIEQKITKFKQFLAETDYKVLPDYDLDSTEVKVKRQEAREFIRANETLI
jgi:membrane-associated HD superfamily phosphohydrolase